MNNFFKNEKIKKLSLFHTIHLFHNYEFIDFDNIDDDISCELEEYENLDINKIYDIDEFDKLLSMLSIALIRFQQARVIVPWTGIKFENFFMDFDTFSKTSEYETFQFYLNLLTGHDRAFFINEIVECIIIAKYFFSNDFKDDLIDFEDCESIGIVLQAFFSKFDIYFSRLDKADSGGTFFCYDDDVINYWNTKKESLMSPDSLYRIKEEIYFNNKQYILPSINKQPNRLIRYNLNDTETIDFNEERNIPNVHYLGSIAFVECDSDNIILPSTITYIGKYTFDSSYATKIDFSKITNPGVFYDYGIKDVLNYKEFKKHLLDHGWKQLD